MHASRPTFITSRAAARQHRQDKHARTKNGNHSFPEFWALLCAKNILYKGSKHFFSIAVSLVLACAGLCAILLHGIVLTNAALTSYASKRFGLKADVITVMCTLLIKHLRCLGVCSTRPYASLHAHTWSLFRKLHIKGA